MAGISVTSNMPPTTGPITECALGIKGSLCVTKNTIQDIKKSLKNDNTITDDEVLSQKKQETGCTTNLCAVKKTITEGGIKNKEDALSVFKPEGPSNSTALLNNKNIDDVLKKLTFQYPDLYHMGFQMIDFAGEPDGDGWRMVGSQKITPTALGLIDMVKDVLDKGFKMFCVVLNTDKRTGGGIHWFCIFCDFRTSPGSLEYFNSSGNRPMRQVQEWLIKTEDEINKSGKYKVTCTDHKTSGLVHQIDSETECGLYSLYYIWSRINNTPQQEFQRHRVADADMIAFRKLCFMKKN